MYESYFRLQERPFAPFPQADRYYPAAAVEAARTSLARTIDRAEGVGLIIGPAGCGKTMVLHLLAEQYRNRFTVALIPGLKASSRRALLQAILFEAGLPCRKMEEGELRLSLLDHLRPGPACPNGMLILFDECHTLPPKLLEELRLLTNVVRAGQPRVRLVLAGGPIMEERLAQPRMQSLQQRIAARCYLEPFAQQETVEYVQSQLAAAGAAWQDLFTADALAAVHQASGGVPRVVNQICDHALLMAAAGGVSTIDAAGVEEAWADLQQLPLPWNAPPEKSGAASAVVEFGSLEDDDEVAWSVDEPAASREAVEKQPASFAADEPAEPADLHEEVTEAAATEAAPEFTPAEAADLVAEVEADEQIAADEELAELRSDAPQAEPLRPYFVTELGEELPYDDEATADESIIYGVAPRGDAPAPEPMEEPTLQLERIEQHLETLESAPTPKAVDPFANDEFADEELVLDPGRGLATELLLGQAPPVESKQAEQPAALAGKASDEAEACDVVDEAADDTATIAAPFFHTPDVYNEQPPRGDDDWRRDVVMPESDRQDEADAQALNPADDPVIPEDRHELFAPLDAAPQSAAEEITALHNADDESDDDAHATLPLHSFLKETADGDMLLIEDADDETSLESDVDAEFASSGVTEFAASGVAEETPREAGESDDERSAARRQEYRNLFARLRRNDS